ncbi:GntR family transcriptional regulator [Marinobacterium aestuarii]|uniref:Pyruvate dehydrogenase complex repressor n=1 Tax=Marinobacterium aestuarii TaxID=1821621 RepID=A0A1A9F2J1_9GAMM|nr:FadR/GntR family transcriptional regulator [Marinobacterium aestuarii]ANG63953.1 GntR family transcriptional regulator [Marinobacterium aestuarii]
MKDETDKAQQLVAQLSRGIVEGRFLPGELLPSQRTLAQDCGVSRATVREAITQLELGGLIQTRQGDGSRCQNLLEPHFEMPAAGAGDNLAFQLQVLEMRAALEGEAAYNCARRASAAELAGIEREYACMVQRSEGQSTLAKAKADLRFHMMIAQSSHNLLLISFSQLFYSRYFNAIYGVLDRTLKRYGRYPDGIRAQHAGIYQALMARDAEQARRLATEHILFTHQLLEQSDS